MEEGEKTGLKSRDARDQAYKAYEQSLARLKREHDGDIIEEIFAQKRVGESFNTHPQQHVIDQLAEEIGHHIDALNILFDIASDPQKVTTQNAMELLVYADREGALEPINSFAQQYTNELEEFMLGDTLPGALVDLDVLEPGYGREGRLG